MFRLPQPPPLDARVEADRPITPHLLAALSGESAELAETYLGAWLAVMRIVGTCDLVLVFDDLVIGRPEPLLLEVAHHVRSVRRAERLGYFDDEEEQWYEEHPDDDEMWEPPSLTDRALGAMAHQQEGERLMDGTAVDRSIFELLEPDPAELFALIHIGRAMRRLLVELADAVRIGDGVPVDARLRGERADAWRWAA